MTTEEREVLRRKHEPIYRPMSQTYKCPVCINQHGQPLTVSPDTGCDVIRLIDTLNAAEARAAHAEAEAARLKEISDAAFDFCDDARFVQRNWMQLPAYQRLVAAVKAEHWSAARPATADSAALDSVDAEGAE